MADKMKKRESLKVFDNVRRTVETCRGLMGKRGVHSVIQMSVAGFIYTGDRDTVRCANCGLEVFNWTGDINPFTIHSEESPHCSYVRSMKPSSLLAVLESSSSSTTTDQKNHPQRRKIDLKSRFNNSFEPDSLEQCRKHTFCQWPHRGALSSECMVRAGFFSCNIDDRSTCLHCNLTCERWTPNVDNPSTVHQTLSPTCLYVKEKLYLAQPPSIINGNISSMAAIPSTSIHAPNNTNSIVTSTFTRPVAQNPSHSGLHRSTDSAPRCPVDKSPSIDEQIRKDTVSIENQFDVDKFCCKDFLDNWDPDNNSKIEDDRWFPHWANGKQLYGPILHQKIQETNRAHQRKFKYFLFIRRIFYLIFFSTCSFDGTK
jgi:E3 ubiquitin-protein ligase XIAP